MRERGKRKSEGKGKERKGELKKDKETRKTEKSSIIAVQFLLNCHLQSKHWSEICSSVALVSL